MSIDEDVRERAYAEGKYINSLKDFKLEVTCVFTGYVTVKANSLEEAKKLAEDIDDADVDWQNVDYSYEESEV